MSRTAVFIDGAYLDKVCEIHFSKARMDYRRFVEMAVGDEELLRAYYYHCLPYISQRPSPEDEVRVRKKERFFSAISKIPRFEVRLGKLAFRGRTQSGKPIFIQKSVDVMMAVDMIQIAATKRVDHIVVIAADSDFIPAIKAVKEYGVMTTLWLSRNGSPTSEDLTNEFDNLFFITPDVIDRTKRLP